MTWFVVALWLGSMACLMTGYYLGKGIALNRPLEPDESEAYEHGFRAGYEQCDYDRMVCEMAALHPQKR